MTDAEEREARESFAIPGTAPDLSDGGRVGQARITPMQAGKKLAKGRPAARRAWMWNGTETLLPLAWNPEGTMHDGARKYLLKRHCLCCHTGGFRGLQCPNCVKSNCDKCNASTDPKKIIPNFYLRKEDVPFPQRFYGSINCFLPTCPRRDSKGFLTEQDMRIHAASRHRMEYRAYMESLTAARADEVQSLREKVDALLMERQTGEVKQKQRDRMAKAREAKRVKAAGGVA